MPAQKMKKPKRKTNGRPFQWLPSTARMQPKGKCSLWVYIYQGTHMLTLGPKSNVDCGLVRGRCCRQATTPKLLKQFRGCVHKPAPLTPNPALDVWMCRSWRNALRLETCSTNVVVAPRPIHAYVHAHVPIHAHVP